MRMATWAGPGHVSARTSAVEPPWPGGGASAGATAAAALGAVTAAQRAPLAARSVFVEARPRTSERDNGQCAGPCPRVRQTVPFGDRGHIGGLDSEDDEWMCLVERVAALADRRPSARSSVVPLVLRLLLHRPLSAFSRRGTLQLLAVPSSRSLDVLFIRSFLVSCCCMLCAACLHTPSRFLQNWKLI